MGKLKVMPQQAIIDGFKGTIDFYVYMGIPCFRKWPKSPGKLRAPAVMATWASFSYIANKWLLLPDEIRAAYEEMASGTGMTGRDMFTRSYLSGLFDVP